MFVFCRTSNSSRAQALKGVAVFYSPCAALSFQPFNIYSCVVRSGGRGSGRSGRNPKIKLVKSLFFVFGRGERISKVRNTDFVIWSIWLIGTFCMYTKMLDRICKPQQSLQFYSLKLNLWKLNSFVQVLWFGFKNSNSFYAVTWNVNSKWPYIHQEKQISSSNKKVMQVSAKKNKKKESFPCSFLCSNNGVQIGKDRDLFWERLLLLRINSFVSENVFCDLKPWKRKLKYLVMALKILPLLPL